MQVWSGDLSGVITVWNAQRLKKESEIHLPETGVYSMRQVGSHVWIGGDSHIICYNLKVPHDMLSHNARPLKRSLSTYFFCFDDAVRRHVHCQQRARASGERYLARRRLCVDLLERPHSQGTRTLIAYI